MHPGREAEQFRAQVGQPRCPLPDIEAEHSHAAAHRLSPHRLVAAACELFAAVKAFLSMARRVRNGPTPEVIWPCSSAQNNGFHLSTRSHQASTQTSDEA